MPNPSEEIKENEKASFILTYKSTETTVIRQRGPTAMEGVEIVIGCLADNMSNAFGCVDIKITKNKKMASIDILIQLWTTDSALKGFTLIIYLLGLKRPK